MDEYDLRKYPRYTKTPIMMNKVRVLRPEEYERIRNCIPKPFYRTMFQMLLYTGMRYIEAKRLFEHPGWYKGEFIHLPQEACQKTKRTMLERYIRLNEPGRMAVEQFIYGPYNLPSNQAWGQNMKRWAEYANLPLKGLCAKTTRKTIESWLVFFYPSNLISIAKSQGHSVDTQYDHYINMPFSEVDKLEMKKYISGWI